MLVPLIPYFLVANIRQDQISWPNGPEFVFDLHTNVSATRTSDPSDIRSDDVYGRLYCRPKTVNVLNCYVENVRQWTLKDSSEEESVSTTRESGEYPFDIVFNDHGIDHLVVPQKTHTLLLNIIRMIVEQLSVGTNLNGKPDGAFVAFQNSTEGECQVTFRVTHVPIPHTGRRLNRLAEYEFDSLPALNKVPGETIQIEKIKDLDNCKSYADFYYGVYGNTRVDSSVEARLVTSASNIEISDTEFKSATKREGMSKMTNDKDYNIVEEVFVELIDIRAAMGAPREIQNAVKTSIQANSEFENLE